MSLGLYEGSVPVFLRYLDRLAQLIRTAQSFAARSGLAPDELLRARLWPDMLPFEKQVAIAANFTLRTCFPLTGQAIPPAGDIAAGFDGLLALVEHTASLLRSLEPARFIGSHLRVLESRAGDAMVSLRASEFLLHYALPNFFFHLGAAYAILRSRGVPLGKADFDGFHAYPATRASF